jgi:hypothetical protein
LFFRALPWISAHIFILIGSEVRLDPTLSVAALSRFLVLGHFNSSSAAASTDLTCRILPGLAQSMTETGGWSNQIICLIFADKIASV